MKPPKAILVSVLIIAACPANKGASAAVSTDPFKRPVATGTAGIYDLEYEYTFNVLDDAYYDPSSGQISLIGHRDERFKGPRIHYLQHLATLLKVETAKFSLEWTAESERRVNALFGRTTLLAEEKERLIAQITTVFDADGKITEVGRLILPSLNVSPITDGKLPGYFGAEAQSSDGKVLLSRIAPNSPADSAGFRRGDVILNFNDRPPLYPKLVLGHSPHCSLLVLVRCSCRYRYAAIPVFTSFLLHLRAVAGRIPVCGD